MILLERNNTLLACASALSAQSAQGEGVEWWKISSVLRAADCAGLQDKSENQSDCRVSIFQSLGNECIQNIDISLPLQTRKGAQ